MPPLPHSLARPEILETSGLSERARTGANIAGSCHAEGRQEGLTAASSGDAPEVSARSRKPRTRPLAKLGAQIREDGAHAFVFEDQPHNSCGIDSGPLDHERSGFAPTFEKTTTLIRSRSQTVPRLSGAQPSSMSALSSSGGRRGRRGRVDCRRAWPEGGAWR